MLINYVIGKDNKSKIFYDIFKRFSNYLSSVYSSSVRLVVSEKPIQAADIYHYHRPHIDGISASPAICTVHHDLDDTDLSLDESLFIEQYRLSDLIICLNTKQQKYLSDKGIHHTVVIPHGYDERLLDYKKKITRQKKICIGFISKRYSRGVKGELYLYEIAKRLPNTNFSFLLAGSWRRQDAFYLRNLGFDVICVEYLPYNTLLSVYKEIDLLLMCSVSEGGPANLPEALASRTPVFATDVGMVSDLIESGSNGYILSGCPDTDISKFLSFSSFEYTIPKSKIIRSNLISWEANFAKHISCYESLLENTKETNIQRLKSRLLVPLNNLDIKFNIPSVIVKGEDAHISLDITNRDCFIPKSVIERSEVYIALYVLDLDGDRIELLRVPFQREFSMGNFYIDLVEKISTHLEGEDISIGVDFLSNYLGWFYSDCNVETVNILSI